MVKEILSPFPLRRSLENGMLIFHSDILKSYCFLSKSWRITLCHHVTTMASSTGARYRECSRTPASFLCRARRRSLNCRCQRKSFKALISLRYRAHEVRCSVHQNIQHAHKLRPWICVASRIAAILRRLMFWSDGWGSNNPIQRPIKIRCVYGSLLVLPWQWCVAFHWAISILRTIFQSVDIQLRQLGNVRVVQFKMQRFFFNLAPLHSGQVLETVKSSTHFLWLPIPSSFCFSKNWWCLRTSCSTPSRVFNGCHCYWFVITIQQNIDHVFWNIFDRRA